MAIDGAYWLTEILDSRSFHHHMGYLRQSTYFPQIPVYLSLRLTDHLHFNAVIFCLGYALYPLVVFFLFRCWIKPMTLTQPIFVTTFLFAALPCFSFAVAVAHEAVIIYLLFLSYILSSKTLRKIPLLLLTALLFFTYEASLLFYPVLIYFLFREKKMASLPIFLLLASFLGKLHYVQTALVANNEHQFFMHSLQMIGQLPLFELLTIFPLVFLGNRFFPNRGSIVFLIFLLILGHVIFKFPTLISASTLQFYSNRIWTVPGAALISVCLYETSRLSRTSPWLRFERLLPVAVLPIILFEFVTTYQAFVADQRAKALFEAAPLGCSVIDRETYQRNFIDLGFDTIDHLFVNRTIALNEGNTIRKLIFVELIDDRTNQLIPNRFCQDQNHVFSFVDNYGHDRQISYRNLKFDFEPRSRGSF